MTGSAVTTSVTYTRPSEPDQDQAHFRACAAKCSECDQTQMCIQLRCHGCWVCRRCLERLAAIITHDAG